MTDHEQQITDLVERWARAVHAGDLSAVLADHADDIVMFDVPPPHEGVRGLDAYRETWPPFFGWQASGARFDIETLDVTAGEDVGFAHALLRCGTPADLDARPEVRLRLTVGVRRDGGRWVVTHEHHSFADTGGEGEPEIRAIHEQWSERTAGKDLDGLMEHVADDVVSFEHAGDHMGIEAVSEACASGLDAGPEVAFDVPELTVLTDTDLAVSFGHDRVVVDGEETWSRGTRVFARREGTWTMVHQHLSVPQEDPRLS